MKCKIWKSESIMEQKEEGKGKKSQVSHMQDHCLTCLYYLSGPNAIYFNTIFNLTLQ